MLEETNISEINEAEFEEKVLNASSDNLILVDFWAPWCGPCKQLTPLLEKIINKAKGKVKLVKINIDENQQIAAQLKIQSIPAVFAFKDNKPVDAFQGVIPEKKIVEFIEKSLGKKIEEDHTDFYTNINKLLSDKDFENAKEALEDFIANNSKEYKGLSLYIDCMGYLNLYDEIKVLSDSLNEEALLNNFIKSSLQKIEIKKKNNDGPPLEHLIDKFNKSPNKIENITKLADKYFAKNMLDEAFELLLNNYKRNKEKIKIKFLEYFEALGNEHDKTIEFRKKLSSIMFA
jgi:putative thioredoxin